MHPLISRSRTLAAFIVLAAAAWAPSVGARTFVVDNTSDPSTATCEFAGSCTLRQAILDAVATAGRDVITFDPAVFPPGTGATIPVESPLPTIADPAGTVIDGSGAGVVISSEIGGDMAPDGLVFASAPGQPLLGTAIRNVTVINFAGSGVVICGGAQPDCDQDIVAPVVERVAVNGSGGTGIIIQGRNVGKPVITESTAVYNGTVGMLINGFGTVSGARITRSAVRGNDFAGIWIGPLTGTISDLVISDTSAADSASGIVVSAADQATKVTLANIAATDGEGLGIYVSASALSSITLTNVVSSRNHDTGIAVDAETISSLVFKEVFANANEYGIRVDGTDVSGAKLTDVTAVGNQLNGITLTQLRGAKIGRVAAVGNGVQGLVLRGSGNVLKQVRVAENIGDGIRLAGPGGGNRVEKSSGTGNQGPGIYVDTGNVGNLVQKNVALGSDSIDLYDANPGCGANIWKSNAFERRNEPCIR